MKYLTVIRHAKSQGPDTSLPDKDRELIARGRADALLMAKIILDKNACPDMLVASSAVRVRQTVELLNSVLRLARGNILFEESLFMALFEEMAQVVRNTGARVNHLAIVGHNPCVTNFVSSLCGVNIDGIPTCGVAHIELPVDSWETIADGSGKLIWFEYPPN